MTITPDPKLVREIAEDAMRGAIADGMFWHVNQAVGDHGVPGLVFKGSTFEVHRSAAIAEYKRMAAALEGPGEQQQDERAAIDRNIADLLSDENLYAHRISASIQAAIRQVRADLAEMTGCRNAAMAYAERQHVPIELDDEIDIDGEELASRIEGELLGPGWDWEDDRTPGLLAKQAVAVIRPHLARLTDQSQKARAALAEAKSEQDDDVRAVAALTAERERIALYLERTSNGLDQDAERFADERSPLLQAQAEALWDAAQRIRAGGVDAARDVEGGE